MKEVRNKLLADLMRIDQWRFGSDKSKQSKGDIQWIQAAVLRPITEAPVIEVGLTRDGHWVVAAADGSVVEVEQRGNYLPLFPLLELPRERAMELFRIELSGHGLSTEWLDLFPIDQLIASALASSSRFWPEFALRWVNPLNISTVVLDALRTMSKQAKTQQLRHQALRLIAQHAGK